MSFVGFNVAYRFTVRHIVFRAGLIQPVHSFSTCSFRFEEQRLFLEPNSFIPRVQPNPTAKNVAVLGGGITGLTTAYEVARTIPDAKITLYEQQERVGGWLNSEVVKTLGGEVLFEWGPRTLRADVTGSAKATVDLISNLNLYEQLIGIHKRHPASLNRFMYYPDHLTRMPGPYPGGGFLTNLFRNFSAFFTEPIFAGLAKSIIAEPSVKLRASDMEDESVGDFLSRRFGPAIADNLASGLIHGIYAGDVYKLSMRSLFPLVWYLERRDPDGSGIFAEMLELYFRGYRIGKYDNLRFLVMTAKANESEMDDEVKNRLRYVTDLLSQCSVFTFVHGIGTLTRRLEEVLRENKQVTIRTDTSVELVTLNPSNQQLVVSASGETSASNFDYVVSTLGAKKMEAIWKKSSTSGGSVIDKHITTAFEWVDHAVNVMVVNLYYSNPDLIPKSIEGFGYLIPRSIAVDQNPERALGVIFGSESSGGRGAGAIQSFTKVSLTPEEMDFKKKLFEQGPGTEEHKSKIIQELLRNHSAAIERGQKIMDANKADMRDYHARRKAKKSHTKKDLTDETELQTRRIGQDTAPGTKLTVMLGGHWWDGWAKEDFPSETEAIEMAKSVLERHLKIREPPLVAKAKLQQNAIPQYRVGRRRAMAQIHKGLLNEYKGRLKVAGPWWQTGVGVNDSIKKARETAFAIREQWDDQTGLEDYCEPEKWCVIDRKSRNIAIDPMS